MNKIKIIPTLILLFCIFPLMAQNAPGTVTSTAFSTLNIALGLVALVQIIAIVAVVSYMRRVSERTDIFMKMRELREADKLKPVLLLIFFIGGSSAAMAQGGSVTQSMDSNSWILLILNGVLLLAFLYVVRTLFKSISWFMPPKTEAEKAAEIRQTKKQTSFAQVLTDAVPVEREDEIMLD